MKYKIIINKQSTAFYFPKEESKMLKDELSKIAALRNYILVWDTNRFIMKYSLTQQMKSDILSIFEAPSQANGKEIKIIRGHNGCLITGHRLVWK